MCSDSSTSLDTLGLPPKNSFMQGKPIINSHFYHRKFNRIVSRSRERSKQQPNNDLVEETSETDRKKLVKIINHGDSQTVVCRRNQTDWYENKPYNWPIPFQLSEGL
jgi:predicted glycosyltransferase involved in capsule biosynthesis